MFRTVKLTARVANLSRKLVAVRRERDVLQAKVHDLQATLAHVRHENALLHTEHAMAAHHIRRLQGQRQLA